jgi:hypothetical protein
MPSVRTLQCVIVDDNRPFMTIAAHVVERDGVAVVSHTRAGSSTCGRHLSAFGRDGRRSV